MFMMNNIILVYSIQNHKKSTGSVLVLLGFHQYKLKMKQIRLKKGNIYLILIYSVE